jgi:hypothetical protein
MSRRLGCQGTGEKLTPMYHQCSMYTRRALFAKKQCLRMI